MLRRILLLTALALAVSCSGLDSVKLVISPCAQAPVALTSATAFTVGGKCYVYGGRQADGSLSDKLYIYDPATDKWTDAGHTPLQARVNPCCAVSGCSAYIGLGTNLGNYEEKTHLRDWWRYDSESGVWTQLESFISHSTTGSVCFAHDGVIEVLYGFYSDFEKDIYQYDIATNKWSLKGQGAPRCRMAATGTVLDGSLYFGTGFDLFDICDWFRYSPVGQWNALLEVPGARSMACASSSSRYVYLTGGLRNKGSLTGGGVYDEVLRYDPEANKWASCGRLKDGAINMVGFTLGGKAYFGLGETYEGKILNTIYRIDD